MRRLMLFALVPLGLALGFHLLPVHAEDGPQAVPADAPGWLAAMDWIDGAWIGRLGSLRWEAAYTSAEGGERFSINKVLRDGKVVSYEVERFRVIDDALVMSPFPDGKPAARFTLDPKRSAPSRLVFTNPENEFPKQLIYEHLDGDRIRIQLGRTVGDDAEGPVLALKRAR